MFATDNVYVGAMLPPAVLRKRAFLPVGSSPLLCPPIPMPASSQASDWRWASANPCQKRGR
jgi:hypothetical protein